MRRRSPRPVPRHIAESTCATKIRYDTAGLASRALRAIHKRGRSDGGGGIEAHPYHCPICDGYHLSKLNKDRVSRLNAKRPAQVDAAINGLDYYPHDEGTENELTATDLAALIAWLNEDV